MNRTVIKSEQASVQFIIGQEIKWKNKMESEKGINHLITGSEFEW
jgi:hypothetical protein